MSSDAFLAEYTKVKEHHLVPAVILTSKRRVKSLLGWTSTEHKTKFWQRFAIDFFNKFRMHIGGNKYGTKINKLIFDCLENNMHTEVIYFALNETKDQQPVQYFVSILEDWYSKGVKTIEDAKRVIKEHHQKRQLKDFNICSNPNLDCLNKTCSKKDSCPIYKACAYFKRVSGVNLRTISFTRKHKLELVFNHFSLDELKKAFDNYTNSYQFANGSRELEQVIRTIENTEKWFNFVPKQRVVNMNEYRKRQQRLMKKFEIEPTLSYEKMKAEMEKEGG